MEIIKNLVKDQKGMTGLETAIILIAFVTVASVLGYAVLSAGVFSAQQAKETIYAGIQEAGTNLSLSGSVIGKSTDETNLDTIIFSVKSSSIGGNIIDMTGCDGTANATNKCVISILTAGTYLSDVKWTNSGAAILRPGESRQITIDLNHLGDGKAMSDNVTASDIFAVQIKPAVGATVTVQRSLPGSLEKVMDLN